MPFRPFPPPINALLLLLLGVLVSSLGPTTAAAQILESSSPPPSSNPVAASDGQKQESSSSSSSSSSDTPPSYPVANVVTAQNTIKILACGDSITQGADGDFTWRYRLWEWFQTNSLNPSAQQDTSSASTSPSTSTTTSFPGGAATYITPTLQYVGPYNGTLPSSVADDIDLSNPQTGGAYAATVGPAFSPGGGSAHFAVYGRPAWMDVDLIQAQVATHQPDFVILHLGFNDFGWWGQTAPELLESVRKLVTNARLGRSDVKILIADVSHRLLVKGREDIPSTTDRYNALLKQNALGWSTVESPVVVVKVSEDYDCHVESCPAGKDGLHPNSLGDYQIARAYTKVLHDKYHFGAEPLVVPNIEAIPGFTVPNGGSSYPVGTTSTTSGSTGGLTKQSFTYPPMGIFVVVSLLCLVAVVFFRPRLLKALRPGSGSDGKYQLLPTIREAS